MGVTVEIVRSWDEEVDTATETDVPREKLDLVPVPIATLCEFVAETTVLVDSSPLTELDSSDGVRGVKGEDVEKAGSDKLGLDCKKLLVLTWEMGFICAVVKGICGEGVLVGGWDEVLSDTVGGREELVTPNFCWACSNTFSCALTLAWPCVSPKAVHCLYACTSCTSSARCTG